MFDDIFVYDDCSTDQTVEVCREYTRHIVARPSDVPSFMQDESAFRQAGWEAMIETLNLRDGDWVFSIDADEYIVNALRNDIDDLINEVDNASVNSADIPIPEIWSREGGCLKIRTDGFWNKMSLPRLCRVKVDDTEFRKKTMGCGSTPIYSYRRPLRNVGDLALLHFGYSLPEERRARYDRYTSLKNHGHNPKHIKSIIGRPTLEPWLGEVPRYSYGRILSGDSLED